MQLSRLWISLVPIILEILFNLKLGRLEDKANESWYYIILILSHALHMEMYIGFLERCLSQVSVHTHLQLGNVEFWPRLLAIASTSARLHWSYNYYHECQSCACTNIVLNFIAILSLYTYHPFNYKHSCSNYSRLAWTTSPSWHFTVLQTVVLSWR